MKNKFNNAGVAQVQASVVSLPSEELALTVQQIRNDFKGWMREQFELTDSQDEQLEIMPDDFSTQLAEAIADHYEQRLPVSFYKDESLSSKDKDIKDVILNGKNQLSYTLSESSGVSSPEFSIWIRYQQKVS